MTHDDDAALAPFLATVGAILGQAWDDGATAHRNFDFAVQLYKAGRIVDPPVWGQGDFANPFKKEDR